MLQVFSPVEMLGKREGQGVLREVAGRSGEGSGSQLCLASSASPRPQGAGAGLGAHRQLHSVASNLVCVRALGLEPGYHGWSVGFSVCLFCVYLHLTSFHKGFKIVRAA